MESSNTDNDTPGMTDVDGRSGTSNDPMMGANPTRSDVSSAHSAAPILTDASRMAQLRALFMDDAHSTSDGESSETSAAMHPYRKGKPNDDGFATSHQKKPGRIIIDSGSDE